MFRVFFPLQAQSKPNSTGREEPAAILGEPETSPTGSPVLCQEMKCEEEPLHHQIAWVQREVPLLLCDRTRSVKLLCGDVDRRTPSLRLLPAEGHDRSHLHAEALLHLRVVHDDRAHAIDRDDARAHLDLWTERTEARRLGHLNQSCLQLFRLWARFWSCFTCALGVLGGV